MKQRGVILVKKMFDYVEVVSWVILGCLLFFSESTSRVEKLTVEKRNFIGTCTGNGTLFICHQHINWKYIGIVITLSSRVLQMHINGLIYVYLTVHRPKHFYKTSAAATRKRPRCVLVGTHFFLTAFIHRLFFALLPSAVYLPRRSALWSPFRQSSCGDQSSFTPWPSEELRRRWAGGWGG